MLLSHCGIQYLVSSPTWPSWTIWMAWGVSKSVKNFLVAQVSNHFSTTSGKQPSDSKIWKDIGVSTAPAVLWNQICTLAVNDVGLEKVMNPEKSFRVSNWFRKVGSSFLPPEKVQPVPSITNLQQKVVESRSAEEVQSNNGDAQSVYRTTYRTDPDVLDDHSPSNRPPEFGLSWIDGKCFSRLDSYLLSFSSPSHLSSRKAL